jgi:nanoRNase/pAp phosphatase (c-di-AMP/oligoRNAs hydrolase)
MTTNQNKSEVKLQRLLDLLRGKRSLLIVMQDNPDPDSIAAAAALRRLVNVVGDVSCSIAYGGVVGRAENRALMDYLGLNFRHLDQVDPAKYDAVALVDTQPNAGNNSLPADHLPNIVFDHHPLRSQTRKVPFTDVRSKYGAVSTILFEYLRAAKLKPDPPLATALLYAIRSDTRDLGSEARRTDVEAAKELYPLANTRMLSMIQRGSVSDGYYQLLAQGLLHARIRGRGILADLGKVKNADILGELADLLLRHESTTWVLCLGDVGDMIWLSLRTSHAGADAGKVMERLVAGIGTGGGHETSGGGQVLLGNVDRSKTNALRRKIRDRFHRAAGAAKGRSKKLIRM